jgi:hypothetical protein
MSRQIFRDIEEALAREVRRITFHNNRTQSRTVLQDTFDPVTGEIISTNIEADFYDSSAETGFRQYPNFFIKLVKTREDRTTNRVTPPYGKYLVSAVNTAPKAYEIVTQYNDGIINPAGNSIATSHFKLKKVQVGNYIRLLSGNNKGTYIVSAVTINPTAPHSITVSSNLLTSLPAILFQATPREVYFTTPVDLNTVKVGDNFIDSTNTSFSITSVDIQKNMIVIGGVGTPSLLTGGKVSRVGNVFQNTDLSPVSYLVLDPTKPVTTTFSSSCNPATSEVKGVSPQIPIDAYYLIRVDSKERQTHIDVLNRIWEEFNPPRTGLPVIVRTANSYEQLLTVDVPLGGSNTITVKNNANYNINDPVIIFNRFKPTKNNNHGFDGHLETKIVGKISNNQLVLATTLPDTFKVVDETTIVSNANLQILMFHFVDHITKDIEGAQYWVHEFTFWVQLWVDRLEAESSYNTVITRIATPIENLQGDIIIQDS